MLNISFFIAAFSSIFWFFYSLRFVNVSSISAAGGAEALFQAVIVILFPLAVIWGIFAVIKSFYAEKQTAVQNQTLLEQLKKNAENANALSCALIAAEKEIKNGFILHEFDTLIADANEILSDIIKRSNSISSAQMEHLWNRTAGGERWLIAKTFIETYNFQTGFAGHLLQKAQKDSLLRGSILEFEARIKSLCRLLEIHDTQRIFYNMVEYGALGKVYGIISPIASQLSPDTNSSQIEKDCPQDKTVQQPLRREKHSFTSDELSLSPRQDENFPSFLSRPEETSLHFALSEPKPEKFEETSIRPETGSSPADEKRLNIDAGLRAIRNEILSTEASAAVPATTAPADDTNATPIIKSFAHTQTALRNLKKSPYSAKIMKTHKQTLRENSALSPLRLHFLPAGKFPLNSLNMRFHRQHKPHAEKKTKKLFRLMNLKKRLMRHRITITTNTHTLSEPGWMIKTINKLFKPAILPLFLMLCTSLPPQSLAEDEDVFSNNSSILSSSVAIKEQTPPQITITDNISLSGVPKYVPGFTHFNYVNPDAPKKDASFSLLTVPLIILTLTFSREPRQPKPSL